MKIRNGFVSNSSTCSFLIYGICLENSDITDKAKEMLEKMPADERAKTLLLDEDNDLEDIDGYELLEIVMNDTNGYSWNCPYDDEWFIGKTWNAVKDDETGKQFKDGVEKTLKEKFGDSIECSTHSEAWQDG